MIKIKRPLFICTIGFLIGIIYGLYFEKSIAFVIIGFFILFYILKKLLLSKNVLRYIKVLFPKSVLVLFCTMAIVSNTYLIFLNNMYEKIYLNNEIEINANGVIISNVKEKEYTYSYVVQIKQGEFKNKRLILNLKKMDKNILQYGDLIYLEGEYQSPSKSKNYKGFNYANYLKSQKTYGIIFASKVEVLKINKINIFFKIANNIRNAIKNKADLLLPDKTKGLLLGILIGNKDEILEETIENFRNSNLSHVLAVSGMHTSYIILRTNIFSK